MEILMQKQRDWLRFNSADVSIKKALCIVQIIAAIK